MNTIKDLWNNHIKNSSSKDMSFNGTLEQKNAFFSGAGALFVEIMKNAEDLDISNDEGDKWINEISAEVKFFMEENKKEEV